jgi:flagellar protein FliO/FliZ
MDLVDFGRYAGGLLVTLGLLALLGWGAKRLDLLSGMRGERAGRSLAVVETLPIDARRRLALVRWGGREHLVLLGAGGDLLLESRDAVAPVVVEAAS